MQTSVSKIKMWSLESPRALGDHKRGADQVTKGMIAVLRLNTRCLAKSPNLERACSPTVKVCLGECGSLHRLCKPSEGRSGETTAAPLQSRSWNQLIKEEAKMLA